MSKPSREAVPVDHEENKRRAYYLWEKASKPSGLDLHFWLMAERQLRAALQGPASKTPGDPKPARTNGGAKPKTNKRPVKPRRAAAATPILR